MAFWTRWRRKNAVEPPRDVLERLRELERTVDDLKLERPKFLSELEGMYERCHDILDQAESKRGRIAAAESRARKKQQGDEQGELAFPANDREAMKAQVRNLLRAQGKIH